LEFSIAAQVVKLERFALLFPLIALGCSLYDVNASAAFFAFRDEYRSVVAAPAFLILLGAGIFYWIALFRRIPLAQFGLAVTIGLFSAIGPDTDDVHAIALLSPWPIAASASFLFARGLLIRSTVEMFAGVLVSALAIAIGLPNVPDSWKLVICIHWVGIGVLGLGVFFQDAFARFLRIVAAGFLLTGSLLAMRDWRLPGWMWPDWIPYLYLFVLAMTAFALAYHFRSRVYLIMAFLQITAAGSLFAQQISAELQKRPDWRGMASVSFAFLLLAIAGGISAVKGGAFDRILARALRRDD